MNSVHEVQENNTFTILISNFSRVARSLPKGMIIAFASRSSIELVALTSGVAHELGAIYDMFPTTQESSKDPSSEYSESDGDETMDQD